MMRRMLSATVFVVFATALAAGCGGGSDNGNSDGATTAVTDAAGTSSATLTGSVGPGFEISMVESSVAPGAYTLTVDDKASNHNFHFTGDGVDVKTEVSETGTKTFAVTLKAGEYTYVCDPHASSMNGTLTVG